MLMPKKVKHRKQQRRRNRGKANSGNKVSFGEYGLQCLENAWLDSRQIEAARRTMTGFLKRGGKIWIRVFPDKPVTSIPAETRMGKGKGNPEYWVAVVKRGHLLIEIGGVNEKMAVEAIRLAGHKLSVKTRFVSKSMME